MCPFNENMETPKNVNDEIYDEDDDFRDLMSLSTQTPIMRMNYL
jgi:hypothetical protein